MLARAVIDSNFGDSGKGLMTDYLCAKEGAGVVVRFNGGAQAGHTVQTPAGARHVFSHFGSGTFLGVPTYLSRFFVCNPLLFAQEQDRMPMRAARVYASPDCLVTTFADMLINQAIEDARGDGRHGSCGVGFNETIERSARFPLTMRQLWDEPASIEAHLDQVCRLYAVERIGRPITVSPEATADFLQKCRKLAACTEPRSMAQFKDPVFEGAQGLLLDQNRTEFFPHLTRSNTGAQNVRELCAEIDAEVTLYYVSRTYLTRHGAGPLPGEDPSMSFSDLTNVAHPYQGKLRFAPLDGGVVARCAADARGPFKLVLTHCDQLPPPIKADIYSFGPTRAHVRREV